MIKKLISSIVFVFIVVALSFVCFKNIDKISFFAGKKLFEAEKYEVALKFFKPAIRINPKKKEFARFYLETLLKLPKTTAVQKELIFLAESKKINADISYMAFSIIKSLREKALKRAGKNYIKNAAYSGKILRWESMPLKVKVKNMSGVPRYYVSSIDKAFKKWQEISSGMLSFVFSEEAPDIEIDFISAEKSTKQKAVAATTEPIIAMGRLKKMQIKLNIKDANGRTFSESMIYSTILHEVGHSLGIMGHSENPNDIMYPTSYESPESSLYSAQKKALSIRDINTIKLLYSIYPDISNSLQKDLSQGYLYSGVILGSKRSHAVEKIKEARSYVKDAPYIFNGWNDLGIAYMEAGEHSEGVQFLKKALSLAKRKDEEFIAYSNLAIAYMNLKDYERAEIFAQKALTIRQNDDLESIIAECKIQAEKDSFSIRAYEKLVRKEPDNIDFACSLADAYLKKFQFQEAYNVLAELIKNNPPAKDSDKLKKYMLLIFIFKKS